MQAVQNRKRIPTLTQLFGICTLAATLTACPPQPATPTAFDILLNGSQVVPSVTTTGLGSINATANGTTLTVAGDVHSLKGVISSTNLYCGAPIGQNVVDPATFVALSYSNSTSVSGAGTIFGTITGGTQAQFDLLTANQCYIVVFTKIGLQPIAPEIRGQVIKRSGS